MMSEQTKQELARGWLSRSSIGLSSTPDAIDRMGTLLLHLHASTYTPMLHLETDAHDNIYIVLGEEKTDDNGTRYVVPMETFREPASPNFPSPSLVARVCLAVRFGAEQ